MPPAKPDGKPLPCSLYEKNRAGTLTNRLNMSITCVNPAAERSLPAPEVCSASGKGWGEGKGGVEGRTGQGRAGFGWSFTHRIHRVNTGLRK